MAVAGTAPYNGWFRIILASTASFAVNSGHGSESTAPFNYDAYSGAITKLGSDAGKSSWMNSENLERCHISLTCGKTSLELVCNQARSTVDLSAAGLYVFVDVYHKNTRVELL
eukprot:g5897.t1